MINIPNFICEDNEAFKICKKHVNNMILSGIYLLIDTYGDERHPEVEADFETDECFAEYFPKGFKGKRMTELRRIRDLIEKEEDVELTPSEKFILMSCLRAYYEDSEEDYSLEKGAKASLVDHIRHILNLGNLERPVELNIQPIQNVEERFYVMSYLLNDITKSFIESGEDFTEMDARTALEYHMMQIEDLRFLEEICFDDIDYEFLSKFTPEELKALDPDNQMGLDV